LTGVTLTSDAPVRESVATATRRGVGARGIAAGVAIGLGQSMRLKLSYERYDFSDFDDESVIHAGIAGPF